MMTGARAVGPAFFADLASAGFPGVAAAFASTAGARSAVDGAGEGAGVPGACTAGADGAASLAGAAPGAGACIAAMGARAATGGAPAPQPVWTTTSARRNGSEVRRRVRGSIMGSLKETTRAPAPYSQAAQRG